MMNNHCVCLDHSRTCGWMFTRIDRNGQGVIHFGVDPSPDVDPVSLSAFLNISPWARPDMKIDQTRLKFCHPRWQNFNRANLFVTPI